jgi:hypothetical protein
MFKKYLSIVAISLVNQCCYALDISGGELLNSHTEISPGIKGEFKSNQDENISKQTHKENGSTSSAKTSNKSGKTNTNIRLDSNHSYYIHNSTGVSQVYTIQYLLESDGQLIRKVDNVRLSSGGTASDQAVAIVLVYHSTPGSFPIVASTSVIGESPSNSSDRATLTVTR